jgi:hypothetical protein
LQSLNEATPSNVDLSDVITLVMWLVYKGAPRWCAPAAHLVEEGQQLRVGQAQVARQLRQPQPLQAHPGQQRRLQGRMATRPRIRRLCPLLRSV